MNWYEKINYYYKEKLWTIDQVKVGVERDKITQEQFKEITGEDYSK
ncbi:MAG: XkdX family protein [Paeniclostridium sordellii]|nr:XkdX family protein [Paeniclostridium sordellii]